MAKTIAAFARAYFANLAVYTAADSTTPTKLVVRASLPSAMVAAKMNR